MKKLFFLLVLAGAGYLGYSYFVTGVNPLPGLLDSVQGLPTRDEQGRELAPCHRCLATGLITCTAPRCKEGQVPCPGPCLKKTDGGWQRMPGQDPNKLFMIYRINGGSQGVSEAHIGEVFEVRFGEFHALGVCKICQKKTTVPCKACGGASKVTCKACGGTKVVLKDSPPKAKAPGGS